MAFSIDGVRCVLLRDAAILKEAYRIMPEYLADVHRNAAEVNPAITAFSSPEPSAR